MNSVLKELEEYRNLWIRSQIKFQWDFKKSLAELVLEIEYSVSKEIIPNYWVEYTSYWDQIIKIKIKDETLMVEKLITCTLFYSKNDKIYWYITLLFASAEKWQKTKRYELKKIPLVDNKKIVKTFITKLIDVIEEF